MEDGNTAGVWIVSAFIFSLDRNRNLCLKPGCKAQVCSSSWRLAPLGVTGLSSTEFTERQELPGCPCGACSGCSQFEAEISALAAVFHTCEVGLALGDTLGGGGIIVCPRNLDCLFSTQHPLGF